MWMYCGAMWISTFQMWINADILWVSIMEIYVNPWINSKLMWTATLKMWIHHISTSWQCGSTTSPHFHNVEFPHLHIRQFDLYPLFNQFYFLSISQVDSSMVHSLWQLSERLSTSLHCEFSTFTYLTSKWICLGLTKCSSVHTGC